MNSGGCKTSGHPFTCLVIFGNSFNLIPNLGYVNIGKAGFYAEFFSRIPADTDVILGDDFCFASPMITPDSLCFRIELSEIRHTIQLDKDGKLTSKVRIPLRIGWNDKNNVGCKCLLHDLVDMYLYKFGYDRRKFPKVETLAKTIANNPCAFLDALSEFQKKYKRNKEEGTQD